MEYRLQSKYRDADFARKTLLVGRQTVHYTPQLGTVLRDESAGKRDVRKYRKLTIEFADVHAWHIEDAVLTDQFIVHRGADVFVDSSILTHYRRQRTPEQVLETLAARLGARPPPPIEDYQDATALVMFNEGGWTWGHHLVQNLPRILLYLRHFPDARIVLPRAFRVGAENNFARSFEEFGISGDRQILVDRGCSYKFKELVILDFLFDFDGFMAHPLAIDMLSNSRTATAAAAVAGGGGIAIERDGETRAIANQAACEAVLREHAVVPRKLGAETLAAQITAWQGERFFAATLGSDLANMVFAPAGARVLALSPDWFGDEFFYNLAVAKTIQWNELRCGTLGVLHPTAKHRSSFQVDPELLDVMLSTLAPMSGHPPSVRLDDAGAAPAPGAGGLEITVHVRDVGDVRGIVAEWAGGTEPESWIEGFALHPAGHRPGGLRAEEVLYQAVDSDGSLSAAVPGGVFCGTTGRGRPLAGFIVRLTDAAALRWHCSYWGRFADGTEMGPVDADARCQAPGLAALTAMRIALTRRAAG